MRLINIGYGNMISSSRIIAIVSPEAAPVKRMVQTARDKGLLIDASYEIILSVELFSVLFISFFS